MIGAFDAFGPADALGPPVPEPLPLPLPPLLLPPLLLLPVLLFAVVDVHGPCPALSHNGGCGAISASRFLFRSAGSNVGLLQVLTSRRTISTKLSAVLNFWICSNPALTR